MLLCLLLQQALWWSEAHAVVHRMVFAIALFSRLLSAWSVLTQHAFHTAAVARQCPAHVLSAEQTVLV
jgi:hypothetical protein